MKLIKLNCPACGGTLELPDNLTVAHCVYCGNKILLDQDGIIKERRDLDRYRGLLRVAAQAQNHTDVIRYCNLILEIEPNDAETWIYKANSTFSLTTAAHDRYNEALEYLNKAAQIEPDNKRINSVRQELTQREATWLYSLAENQLKIALSLYGAGPTEHIARERSRDYMIKAMGYLLLASDLAPDSLFILENIEVQFEKVKWINRSDRVYSKLNALNSMRTMQDAKARLPVLKAELAQAKQDLARLGNPKGLFAGTKIRDAESKVKRLDVEIAKLEEAASLMPTDARKPME